MHTRGKPSLVKSPSEPQPPGRMFWSDSPQFPSPRQHWLIWWCSLSPCIGVHSTRMLLGGLWPLLLLGISILLLSAGSLTPVPTLGSQLGLLDAKPPGTTSAIGHK